MSEFVFEVQSGNQIKLLTAGKYCDRDILVKALSDNSGVFKKVGSMECGYTPTTLDITSYPWWQDITEDNIYLVPTAFTVTATGNITAGTYYIRMSYSNGIITAQRDSVPGAVGIMFTMDVYVYQESDSLSGAGRIVKVASNQPLAAGDGVSIDVKNILPEYSKLTADNFYLDLTKLDINATTTGSGSATVLKQYDASTGVFKFSRASIPFSGSLNNYCDVYAFVPIL